MGLSARRLALVALLVGVLAGCGSTWSSTTRIHCRVTWWGRRRRRDAPQRGVRRRWLPVLRSFGRPGGGGVLTRRHRGARPSCCSSIQDGSLGVATTADGTTTSSAAGRSSPSRSTASSWSASRPAAAPPMASSSTRTQVPTGTASPLAASPAVSPGRLNRPSSGPTIPEPGIYQVTDRGHPAGCAPEPRKPERTQRI